MGWQANPFRTAVFQTAGAGRGVAQKDTLAFATICRLEGRRYETFHSAVWKTALQLSRC